MTTPETQYSKKEGSQYSKEKIAHDTLKVEEGHAEHFCAVSFLTKSFENATLLMFFIKTKFSIFFLMSQIRFPE